MKRVFRFSHTLVTFSRRVRVKFMFSCLTYNLFALGINSKGRVNYRNSKEKSIKYSGVVGVLLFIWTK